MNNPEGRESVADKQSEVTEWKEDEIIALGGQDEEDVDDEDTVHDLRDSSAVAGAVREKATGVKPAPVRIEVPLTPSEENEKE